MTGLSSKKGFTLLELLIVVAIVGVVLGIGVINGQRIAAAQEQRAAVQSVRLLISQGATAAASRGITGKLVRTGDTLTAINTSSNSVMGKVELPEDVTSNLPEGDLLDFLPPGKLKFEDTFPRVGSIPTFTITALEKTHTLQVSIIGEIGQSE